MILDIKVPSPGESISEVQIARWLKKDGDYVQKEEEICEIDSDKATLTVNSEQAGQLKVLAKDGDTVKVGSVIAKVDTDAKAPAVVAKPAAETKAKEEKAAPAPASAKVVAQAETSYAKGTPSPAAKKLMAESNIGSINGTGKAGRVTKSDVLDALANGFKADNTTSFQGTRDEDRQKMSALRKKLGQRLVAVKNQTAMLTTFNEVDMSAILALREKYGKKFEEKYGVRLGFMSFFTKAVTDALAAFPAVNAMIDGEEIVYHNYADVGVAVSAPKGLVVPILRNAESMSLAQIESKIKELAVKARDNKLSLEEMNGGTFTITNGGVFGSLMSTPIINPPQSAILGMHNVVDRPVAVKGKVEIHPMMYIALSYDHRIIDGRESVSFLVKVKQGLEDPNRLLFGSKDPSEVLLGL
ncbi:MAG TPA: 2-oxoglutarate dehydrogenase complex dihydrolipoyllysine-residue succinyltransferase [Bacteroidia bacterium]|jgi:2-oxoglutarate dehydrogenase E2 component (dihydrolipoamide succinyltransferase)|nr:2-oxoglutarate dehydrogenase complex dihydrolipoyllysine-residue succinyltransferase [Bacteroidia bacterium]